MESLPTMDFIEKCHLDLSLEFSQEQDLRYWLSKHLGEIFNIDYAEKVHCVVQLPRSAIGAFTEISKSKGWVLKDRKPCA